MAQITGCELHAGQGHQPGLVMVAAVFPAEGDGAFIHPNHPRIGDGGARDVSAEVVQSAGARAGGFPPDCPRV